MNTVPMHVTPIIAILLLTANLGLALDARGPDSNVLYVSKSGNDASAVPGNLDKPFNTPGAARENSRNSLVYMFPGLYDTNTSLTAQEVNYFMLPGTKISYTGKDHNYLIDDTRFPGGINISIDGFADFANESTFYDSVNHPGLILLTNPLSRLEIRCRDIILRDSNTGTIDIRNCSNVNIDAQRMYGSGHSTGVYWRDGTDIHVKAKQIRTGAYALWEDSSEANVVQDMFADIDYIETGGEGGLYISGKNPNSVLWLKSKLIKCNSSTGVHLTGVSKFYASAQKFWITQTNGALFYLANTGRFWGDGNKATSAGAPFLLINLGTADLTIQQYEESGGAVDVGFDLLGGMVFVHGGRMDVSGTCVRNIGGKNLLEDMLLDSSRGTNSAIIVSGPGLTLKNCTVIAPSGVPSLNATNAQSVRIIGTLAVNTKPSTNITFVGGQLIVDNTLSAGSRTQAAAAVDLPSGNPLSTK